MKSKEQRYTYEDLFDQFIESVDFRLVKYGDVWGLEDLQRANLGGIEQERFENAAEVFERMDIYLEAAYVQDILELLEEVGHEDIEYSNWGELVEKARPLLGEDYQGELDILDAICNHANEIDLNKCCYINN